MSTISNAANAFAVNGAVIGRRVLSVGLAQRDVPEGEKKKTAATVHADIVNYATDNGIMLDRFSSSTCANAATSFDLYVSTALPIPTSSNTKDSIPVAIAGLIESARVKHGRKVVADSLKLAVAQYTEYDSDAEKSVKVADHLEALIAMDAAPKESATANTPEQRLMSALKSADTLALEIESSDPEYIAEVIRLAQSVLDTVSSWE